MATPPAPIEEPVRRWPDAPVAGALLTAMLVLSIAHELLPAIPTLAAAAAAWAAALLLWSRISTAQRVQVLGLGALGAAGLAWAAARGHAIVFEQALASNLPIVAMLAGVSFLRLLYGPGARVEALPRGRRAYLRTMLGVHLFGAVTNISALVIVADRLSREARLTETEAVLLSRAFTMVVFYSPFIGGMALALSVAPGARLPTLMLVGVPLALVGLGLLALLAERRPQAVAALRGYPMRFESLWLPALLASAVIVVHGLAPELSVLTLVSLLAPVVVVAVLGARLGPHGLGFELARFVRERLPDMGGELVLFLSAGVLAAGLSSASSAAGVAVPLMRFDAAAGSALLALTVIIAGLGVHPVVVVSTAAALLAPLAPDPNLLAMVFVMGWGIGCTLSPLSGTNLTLHGRYGVDNWRMARANLGFCTLMTLFASAGLFAYERVAGL